MRCWLGALCRYINPNISIVNLCCMGTLEDLSYIQIDPVDSPVSSESSIGTLPEMDCVNLEARLRQLAVHKAFSQLWLRFRHSPGAVGRAADCRDVKVP